MVSRIEFNAEKRPDSVEEVLRYWVENYNNVFTEAYAITNVVEVVAGGKQYRMEVLRYCHASRERFDVHTYEKNQEIWKQISRPYCDRENEKEALMQALGFLYQDIGKS